MRTLSPSLKTVLDSRNVQPEFKLLAWNSDDVTMSEIVSAANSFDTSSIPAAFDLTPYCTDISWSDRQLSFNLSDPDGIFHPDFGTAKDYIKSESIIRLVQGDVQVIAGDWICIFTGEIHGQIGWTTSRRAPVKTAKITVFSRGESQAYKRRSITTKEYTVGTDIGIMLGDILSTFMGLSSKETRIPVPIGRQFLHKVNQVSQMSPWDAILAILQVVCYEPFFDGDGKLSYISHNLQRVPNKIYADTVPFLELTIPEYSQDSINKVIVTFLDSVLSKVPGARQKLGEAQVTTGFFSLHETLECWWSDDHKQRAEDTCMKIIKSVNSGLLPVGVETYTELDEFHGEIDIEISVWVPILATVSMAAFIALSYEPDAVTPTAITLTGAPSKNGYLFGYVGAPGAPVPIFGSLVFNTRPVKDSPPEPDQQKTIPWGRIAQMAALGVMLLTIMSVGSAQYEIWGQPFDYAYLEKKSIAIEDGLDYWEENQKEIKNDFIGSHDQADAVAVTELIWEKSKSLPRRVIIEDDPSLEVGDIIVLPDTRIMVITALSKNVKRGELSQLQIEGSKVLYA